MLSGSAGVSHAFLSSPAGPEGVAAAYDTSTGAFHPAPKLPNLKQKAKPVPRGVQSTKGFGAATSEANELVPTNAVLQLYIVKVRRISKHG